MKTVHVQPTALFDAAAQRIAEAIGRSIRSHGDCVLGIVGGRTAPALLDALSGRIAAHPFKGVLHLFWLDERVHHDKNFAACLPHLELLYHAGADVRLFPIVGLDAPTALAEAQGCLRRLAALRGRPAFDIVVLSAGEDGHVASLFPGHPMLHARGRRYVLVEDAPKAPPVRITATLPLLLTAQESFLFFTGEKWDAYARFLDPEVPLDECPAKFLRDAKSLTVLVSLEGLQGK